MWSEYKSIETKASKEAIWEVWRDVNNWSTWDHEVLESSIHGEFAIGTSGILKPKNGPKSPFTITEASMNKSFTTTSTLPLGKMRFIHELSVSENGLTKITHGVQISGPLTFLFSKVIGKNIISTLPKALVKLSNQANNPILNEA